MTTPGDETSSDVREAARGFIALVAAHMGHLDTDTFADLAQDVATEGGPNRLSHLLAVGVGMTRDLIHELAVATGQTRRDPPGASLKVGGLK